jgi:predicted GNAT superfamily acetyltransferase
MTGPEDARTMNRVTELDTAEADTQVAVEEIAIAAGQAAHAAAAADVVVHQIADLDELVRIEELYDRIWRPDGNPPVNTELLRAFSKAGNYVAGAYDRDRLVGACVGFFTAPATGALHSHIAGVAPEMAGRHVGFALKLHQRAWALLHGMATVEWTFDPLVARNAYFNIVKLAGRPAEYLPNFYGGMRDSINGGDDTDRLMLRWELADPVVVDACSERWQKVHAATLRERGAVVGLARGESGEPVPGTSDAATVLVAVPHDIAALRLSDPGLAKQWRGAVRDALGDLLADGARITGFDRDGWYVVERTQR